MTMQLDKTRIAVRERSFVDILDLALAVIRDGIGPLSLALAMGIVPMFLLNSWLLAGWVEAGIQFEFPTVFVILLVLLVSWEIPLAAAPATLYLGEALFQQRISPGKIARRFVRSLPQLLVYQVLIRGLLMVPAVTWFVLYAMRPYLNEVILLERTRMRQKSPNVAYRRNQIVHSTMRAKRRKFTMADSKSPSTARRCRTLHEGRAGELLARWIGSLAVGALLLASFWGSISILHGLLLSRWEISGPLFAFYFQSALWLVVGFFTVVRFLGYLDLRIRREGWEVELVLRAERTRLARRLNDSRVHETHPTGKEAAKP